MSVFLSFIKRQEPCSIGLLFLNKAAASLLALNVYATFERGQKFVGRRDGGGGGADDEQDDRTTRAPGRKLNQPIDARALRPKDEKQAKSEKIQR